jgi:ribosomal protein L7Ae-like RNA K-turn-binding protein
MQNRVLQLLGLAMKAGKIASGNFAADEAVKNGQAKLVIVTVDAMKNTSKGFHDSCTYYKVPVRVYSTKEELGHALGKKDRTVAAVLDEGFGGKLMELIGDDSGDNGADVSTEATKRGCNGKNEDQ